MQKRKFDELISHFNCKVSDMSIDQKHKMELLGMISAIGFAHEKELSTNLAEVGTDCISRQALLDKFEPWLKVKDYNDGELNMLKAVLYEIRFMRSAQPKRGWWIEIINSRGVVVALRCSRCEKSPRHGVRSDFCPNCGADMREETE